MIDLSFYELALFVVGSFFGGFAVGVLVRDFDRNNEIEIFEVEEEDAAEFGYFWCDRRCRCYELEDEKRSAEV